MVLALIIKSFLTPLDSSIAVINKIPSTSIENLTFILGIPAGFGSNPDKTNSPREYYSLKFSLSL